MHIPTYMPTGVKVGVRYHPCSLFHCIHWYRVSQSKPELSELSHLLTSSFWGFLSVTWGWNYRLPQCSPEFLLGSRDQSSSFDPHTLTLSTLPTVSWAPIFLCKLIFAQVIVLYHRNFNNKPLLPIIRNVWLLCAPSPALDFYTERNNTFSSWLCSC